MLILLDHRYVFDNLTLMHRDRTSPGRMDSSTERDSSVEQSGHCPDDRRPAMGWMDNSR